MSSEGGPSQPTPGVSDKPQTLKPTTGFSSFINKSGAGKKFGPKAVRRRPGATATAPPAPRGALAALLQPATDPQTQPRVGHSDAAVAESQAAPPPVHALPTPAAIQEPVSTDQESSGQPSAVPPITIEEPVSHNNDRNFTPEVTTTHSESTDTLPHGNDINAVLGSASNQVVAARIAEDPLPSERPAKRQRLESTEEHERQPVASEAQTHQVGNTGHDSPIGLSTRPEGSTEVQSALEQSNAATAISSAVETPTSVDDTVPPMRRNDLQADNIIASETASAPGPQPRPHRALPWQAVNRLGDSEDTQGAHDVEAEDGEDANEQEEEVAIGPRPGRKPRSAPRKGKRKFTEDADTTISGGGEDGTTAPPVKKARKPRKTRASADVPGEEEVQDGQEPGSSAPRPKKARAPRKKKSPSEGATDGTQDLPSSRRRRPEREPTPSDAEDEQIDPGATYMDNLASRNIRVGRLSLREKKMREINWEEVKQRRREEEALVTGTDARNAVNERLNEAGESRNALQQHSSAPRVEVLDGQIVFASNTGSLNREAQADAEIELMEEIQEDDLTTRITSRSFLKNNKRYPAEFMLPGQGRRWGPEATEQFYEALRTFGTDFMMIASMFPGTTRRSIKLKFVREERENPTKIKKALYTPRRNTDWEGYLNQSGKSEDNFKDPDKILNELAEEEARMRTQIDAAKKTEADEKAKRHAAGMYSDNEEEGDGGKENGRKKGRKKRERQQANAAFELRPGEEIVGDEDIPGFDD
jgi:transcription factor TFIIIB component B''